MELLGELAPYYPDEEIARILNCHRLKTGNGNPWNRTRVRGLRAHHKIPPFDRTKEKEVLTLNQAAKRLGMSSNTIRALIKRGMIKAKQVIKHAPFEIEPSELDKEMVKTVIRRLKDGQSLRSIGDVSEGQISFLQPNQPCSEVAHYGA